MSFQMSPAVSIAVDPEVSMGLFAKALGGAGFRLHFQDGTLHVSRLKDVEALRRPTARTRKSAQVTKTRAAVRTRRRAAS